MFKNNLDYSKLYIIKSVLEERGFEVKKNHNGFVLQ